MVRGRAILLPLVVGLLAVACNSPSGFETATPEQPQDLSRDVVLSVLSDAIYLIDPDTNSTTVIARDLGDFRAGYAAWAPDHVRVAYGDGGIYIRDLRTDLDPTALIEGDSYSMPSWSPAGDSLVYGNGAAFWTTPEAALQPLQLHIPATLAPLAMDWGTRGIVFQGLRRDCLSSYRCPTTDESDVWLISPDATTLVRLTYLAHALDPTWSPDGSRVLFVLRTGPRSGELWIVQADGTQPHRVGRASNVAAAAWSPDGSQLATVRWQGDGDHLALWIGPLDGSRARLVGSPVEGTAATVDW